MKSAKIVSNLEAFALATVLAGSTLLSAKTPEQKAWDKLQAATSSKSTEKRTQSVRALRLLPGDSRAVALAEKALQDHRAQVRAAAATALGEMNSESSIAKLEHALDDRDATVALAAARSVSDLKGRSTYEVYHAVLTGQRKSGAGMLAGPEKMFNSPSKAAMFGLQAGVHFVPFAGLGFSVVKLMAQDHASPVRAAAAQALANDPDPRCGEALAKAAADEKWVVRAAAVDAIARRGDPALLKSIEPGLSDGKRVVRYTAAAAIIRLSTLAQSGHAAKT
jgi:HEAT repeat protein